MKCLVCGHKLARFRKLSLGDFCCQEHRAIYVKEQNDRGLARLTESAAASKPHDAAVSKAAGAGTRMYAQFLPDRPAALANEGNCRGHGPLACLQVAVAESTG